MASEQEIIDIIIPFVWLIIPIIGLTVVYKIRTNYKIEQLKTEKKIKNKEDSFAGSINKMLDDAPKQLKQIDSEIATLEEKAKRERLSPEQTKNLLSRLKQERDMLSYAAKYGDVARPFIKPIDKIVNKFMGGFGGT